MLPQHAKTFARSLRALDAVTLAAPGAALLLLDGPPAGADPARRWLFPLFLAASFTILAWRLGIYHSRRTESLRRELLALGETAVLAVAFSTLGLLLLASPMPRDIVVTMGLAGTTLLLLQRLCLRRILHHLRRGGRDHRAWVIVGRNARSATVIRDVLAHPEYGIRIVAILDVPDSRDPLQPADAPAAPRAPSGQAAAHAADFEHEPLASLPCLPFEGLHSLRSIVYDRAVDEVLVALPLRSFYDTVAGVMRFCAEAGIAVKLFPRITESVGCHTEVIRLGDHPLVTHFSGPADGLSLAIKRLIDIAVATLGLLLLLPLMLPIALLIRLDTPGPALFRQQRVGLNGRRFTLLKFRTMVRDAPLRRRELTTLNEVEGPVFKMRHDPRVTRAGRFLRRHHLDELPQLWNVLVGHMSLVGPRPPLAEEIDSYEWWQRRRLSMPPGLTCMWQAHGSHSLSFDRWMRMDLEYIDRWSLQLDFKLMVATVRTVLRGRGW